MSATQKISELSLQDGDDDDPTPNGNPTPTKKKRKRNKKKKEENSEKLATEGKETLATQKLTQTTPKPSIPIDKLFPAGAPPGQITDYSSEALKNYIRENLAEKKALEVVGEETLEDLRRAAEAHRETRLEF